MNTIVCIKQGNDPFTVDYVAKLYSMVKRNTTLPFELICFTDEPEKLEYNLNRWYNFTSIIVKALPVNYLWGWWNKLPLFLLPYDQVLYFDLDLVILDNIDDLLQIRSPFAAIRRPTKVNCVNGTLFTFQPKECANLWYDFDPRFTMYQYRTDQDYITEMLRFPVKWIEDSRIVSYKVHIVTMQQNPNDKKIIYCHGVPKPHELIHLEWVRKHWTIK